MLLHGRQVQVNLLATRSLRVALGSSRFAQGPGESARPVPSRLHTLEEQPGREPSCSLASTTLQGGAQVRGRTRLPGRVTRALRPQPLGKGRDWSGGLRRQSRARSPQRLVRPGRTRKGRGGERMLERGGAGGGGGPCPNSHSPPRSPPGPGSAARPAPVPAARVSSRASRTSLAAPRWGEVRASRGSVASGNEGVGRVGRSFSPPGTPQTRPPPAPLSHGSCGPSHHTGSRLRTAPSWERQPFRPIRNLAPSGPARLGGRSPKEEERGRLVRRRDFL